MKRATSIDEQLGLLRERGVAIDDEAKAKEYLLDIGYYRLGFYLFPFEAGYPDWRHRKHEFQPGTKLDYAVQLYYFDFDLRNILLRYISRVEINLRTTVVYQVSNNYPSLPYWHKDAAVVADELLQSKVYLSALSRLQKEPAIKHHIACHPETPDPPAWKALEFLPFGTILAIYDNLISNKLRCTIAQHYHCSRPSQFDNYIHTVRKLRNYCAHGNVLFDCHLDEAICNGPLGNLGALKTMLGGMCEVLLFFLRQISQNRAEEMQKALAEAYDKVPSQRVRQVIDHNSGIKFLSPR